MGGAIWFCDPPYLWVYWSERFAYLSPAGAGPTLVPSTIIVNAGKIVVPLN
jgi:hypothetical protein